VRERVGLEEPRASAARWGERNRAGARASGSARATPRLRRRTALLRPPVPMASRGLLPFAPKEREMTKVWFAIMNKEAPELSDVTEEVGVVS
jgi:hypothetical protein